MGQEKRRKGENMFRTPDVQSVTILGTQVPVVLSSWKCNKEEALGLYVDDKIWLMDTYESEEEYKKILTHECFHALCDILGCQLDHNMEETLAKQIGELFVFGSLT